MEKDDKGSTLIRIGVSGWKFLLVPAYPGCPGSKAVKRSLLLLLFVANLPLSLSVTEFCKSVNICGSCGQELVSCFFLTHGVVVHRWIYNTATVTIKSPVRVRSQWCGACSECSSDSAHMRSMQDVPGKPATYGTWFSPPPKLRRHQTLSAKIWKSNDNATFLFPLNYHCGKNTNNQITLLGTFKICTLEKIDLINSYAWCLKIFLHCTSVCVLCIQKNATVQILQQYYYYKIKINTLFINSYKVQSQCRQEH